VAADRTADPTAHHRRGFLTLAGLSVAGTAVELAMLRHWDGFVQLIPWVCLALLTAALAALVTRPGPGTIRLVRVVATVVLLGAALGVFEHVLANYRAAPLDFRYTARWPAMSARSRWWAAFSGAVGPSPALAPAILAWAALCVWFATLHHPATVGSSPDDVADRVALPG
jgi:hypothetical protein